MIGAVDIGGTKIAVGVVDENGKVLARVETPSDPNNYSAVVPAEKTELMLASLGDDTNLIGAARVWHHRFA